MRFIKETNSNSICGIIDDDMSQAVIDQLVKMNEIYYGCKCVIEEDNK